MLLSLRDVYLGYFLVYSGVFNALAFSNSLLSLSYLFLSLATDYWLYLGGRGWVSLSERLLEVSRITFWKGEGDGGWSCRILPLESSIKCRWDSEWFYAIMADKFALPISWTLSFCVG